MRCSVPRTSARLIGLVVAAPVLGVKKVLGDPVLVPIVVAEIELARNYIVLHSDHAFKEFECASAGFYFHRKSFMVEMKNIMENCVDFSTRPIGGVCHNQHA
jgi:hypothetical protein